MDTFFSVEIHLDLIGDLSGSWVDVTSGFGDGRNLTVYRILREVESGSQTLFSDSSLRLFFLRDIKFENKRREKFFRNGVLTGLLPSTLFHGPQDSVH